MPRAPGDAMIIDNGTPPQWREDIERGGEGQRAEDAPEGNEAGAEDSQRGFMKADLVLDNARVVTETGVFDGAVVVEGETIAAITRPGAAVEATRIYDCEGKVVLPGLVDPHVHMGGGAPYEELCATESESAARGGVTTMLQYRRSMTSFLESFPPEREAAERLMGVDTAFHFILDGMEQTELIPEYAEAWGITSFKFYMGGYEPGNRIGLVTVSDAVLFRAMELIRELGPHGYCMVHCEDDALVSYLTETVKESGRDDLVAYTESRPAFVEEQDVRRAIWLAELTGSPLYIPHTTIEPAIAAAADARLRGHRILLETCPHYLALTADDERLAAQGAGMGKVSPALRDEEHQEALWRGLREGYVHTVGSDHVPIPKTGAPLWDEWPGFAGLVTMLPVLVTEGVQKGRIDLPKLVQVTSANPARTFGLYPQKGTIAVGSDADLVVADLDREATVSPETTRSKYTSAFEGLPLKGWPVLTVRRGDIIFEDGQYVAAEGSGRIVGPQAAR